MGEKKFSFPSDFLRIVGPAIVAGVSDLGSTDFATDCYAGSAYGFSFLWAILIVTFILLFILQVTAQLGSMTGKGLIQNIRIKYGSSAAVLCSFFIASFTSGLIGSLSAINPSK